MGAATLSGFQPVLYLLAQVDLSGAFSALGGSRVFTGLTMLTHMFFAELFVGFAIAAPVLQVWGARTGSPRMDRMAHSIARFNVLTFSAGGTFAVLFLVLLVGLYPRVTGALFTHFVIFIFIAMASMLLALWAMYTYYYKWDRYSVLNKGRHAALGFVAGGAIWVWMVIMTGIDTFMVTGGGPTATGITSGNNVASFGTELQGILNPMFFGMALHRTFGNLSWPAFAGAAGAAFMYMRVKKAEDKAFFDWATSVGLMWGVGFLLVQPLVGFGIVYLLKFAQPEDPVSGTAAGGAYENLTQGGTSHLLWINLGLVVGLFVLSNIAMYLGAGRRLIQFFGLVAALAGVYSIMPPAAFPVFWVRYVAILIMVLATVGALVTYVRGRFRFRHGSSPWAYRATLLALGVLAAVVALNMGFMKSNSRAPYTIYNQPDYTVESEQPPTGVGR